MSAVSGPRPSRTRSRVSREELGARPGLGEPEPIEIGGLADRVVDVRCGAEGQLDAHRHQRRQNVREDDGGVEPEAADRLQRHLGGDLGRAAHGQEVTGLLSDLAVLGQVASGLAHHPHRRPVDLFRQRTPSGSGSLRARLRVEDTKPTMNSEF